jgi:integrase/recombinase XerD
MKIIIARRNDYVKQDGTAAVNMFIHIKGRKVRIDTGISVDADHWDDEQKRVTGKHAADHNLIISNAAARINDIFVKYRLMNRTVTPIIIKKEYYKPGLTGDFIQFCKSIRDAKEGSLSINTTKTHDTFIGKLEGFRKHISFQDISVDFVEAFMKHIKPGLNPNTQHKMAGLFKTFVMEAVRKNRIEENPFKIFKIKRIQGDRTFLSENELTEIVKLYHKKTLTRTEHDVLRMFIFSCYTGLRLSDVKRISFDNIVGDNIVIQPVKTSNIQKIVRIPLCLPAKAIISELSKNRGLLFYPFADQYINRTLKDIFKDTSIEKHVTFHCARHTFATIFLRRTKNLTVLQKLLGHYSINETMIYAHIITEDIENEMKCFDSLSFV